MADAPNFEALRQVNAYGVEWWSARDLMGALGYTSWQNFMTAVNRAMSTCEKEGERIPDHFREITRESRSGKGRVRDIRDYALDRWACYLIAINGDTTKPEIAAAQDYFVSQARAREIDQLRAQQAQRLEIRERVSEGNVSLAQAAKAAGVQSENFGTFQNAGYTGLYGGLSLEAIKDRKGIPQGEDLLDRAGLLELSANGLRIGLTDARLRSGDVKGEAAAIQTHHRIGRDIRDIIAREGGPLPEDLPAEPSIKPLLDDKKRKKKRAIPPPPDQEKLF